VESKLFMRAGMILYCAATAVLLVISDAGYSYAARFSRSGVASGGSFSPRQAGSTGAVLANPADRVGNGDGHIRDRVAAGDGHWGGRDGDSGGGDAEPPAVQPPVPDEPPEARPPTRDERPGRNCPPGKAGRDCRKYYGYDYDYVDVDDDHIYNPETVETLPCSATVITVDRLTYYRCDNTFYTQIFSDGSVLYVECEPPRGY
jgi:hypothetical protein